MKYKKKPVEVQAFKLGVDYFFSPILEEAIRRNQLVFSDSKLYPNDKITAQIKTLEGIMIADNGDYIIIGVKGEIYPCKPDIFELTYERVEDGK